MANWNYRKRISAGPGMWLNLSKSGVSTSIGGKGTTVNFGKKGTYLTTSIPGTGLYIREKVGGGYDSNKSGVIDFLFWLMGVVFLSVVGFCTRKVELISYSCYGIAALGFIGGIITMIMRHRKENTPKAPRIMEYYPNAWVGGTHQSDVDAEFQKFLNGENPTYKQPEVQRLVAEYCLQSGVVSPNDVEDHFHYNFVTVFLIITELQQLGICGMVPESGKPKMLVHSIEEIDEKFK